MNKREEYYPLKGKFADNVEKIKSHIVPIKHHVKEIEYITYSPPIFIITISIVQVAFFVGDEITRGSELMGTTAKLFIYDPEKRSEIWRYLTYMFVHLSYGQLSFNLLIQLILGITLEIHQKWWRISVTYVSGALAGSLFQSLTNPQSLLAGAGGGSSSLLTAIIVSTIMNWDQTHYMNRLVIFCFVISNVIAYYCTGEFSPVGAGRDISGLLLVLAIFRITNPTTWKMEIRHFFHKRKMCPVSYVGAFWIYIYAHGHLWFNMLLQLIMGVPLEMQQKWWRIMMIYFSGVVTGTLFHCIVDPQMLLAGASGGISSLCTAIIASTIMNWNQTNYVYRYVFSCFITINVLTNFYMDEFSPVGAGSHLSGLLLGFAISNNIYSTKWKTLIRWIALLMFILLMLALVLLNVFGINLRKL